MKILYTAFNGQDNSSKILLDKVSVDNVNKLYISEDAGNFLCNNLYYKGLKYIKENNINCKMIFIHIPKIENISDIDLLANVLKVTTEIKK